MAQLLEEVFSFKDKGASAPKPYHQVKIVENDKIDDLSEILQTNVKKVQTAYYKPVNEKGPNGVKEKGSKGIVLKPDKIFYYPFEKIIDKKLNIHKVFSVYTSIKCMYGPDEPMKNRYILFWETNENGDDFKENRNGSAFGINGDSKPIGLGVTDSDGFLNGKSLKWFTSDDNNITFNNGKFPDHAKEKEICFVCKMQEPSDNYRIKPKLKLEKPEKMSNEDKIYKQLHGITKYHYTKIGSEFRHNLIKNAPLHDIGYGDFIWAKKVSRFNRNRKYSFMALPVDIMNQDTFNSISLFEKDPAFKKFVKTVIPKEINESLNSRQFLSINKPAVKSKHKELMDFQNHEKSNKYFNIPSDAMCIGRNYYAPEFKEYIEPEVNFKYLPKKDEKTDELQKLVTENTTIAKEITLKCTLPEWIARIKICIKETKKHYRIYKSITKQYSDALSTINHVGNISNIVAQFPNKNLLNYELVAPVIFSEKANELQEDILDKLKNLKEEKYETAKNNFIKEAKKLYKLVNDEEFGKEIVTYLNLDKKNKRKPFQAKFNDEEKFYKDIANQLCYILNKSFTLIKNTDIYNFEAEKKDSKSIAIKAYKEYHEIVSNISKGKANNKSPLGIVVDQISKEADESFLKQSKDIVGNYFINAPGTPSLLVCLTDIFGPYIAQAYINNNGINDGIRKLTQKYLKIMVDDGFFPDYVKKINKFIKDGFKKNWREGFSGFIFTEENHKKYPKLIGRTFKSFMFSANLIITLSSIGNKNKNDATRRYMVYANDVMSLGIGGAGLFMKGTAKKITIGTLGIAISALNIAITYRDLLIAQKSGRLKKERLAFVEYVFAYIGLAFFLGIGGFIPSLLFLIAEFGIRHIVHDLIMGGPVEQKIFKICGLLESRDSFLLIDNDKDLRNKYVILMNTLNKFTKRNGTLSWRAIVPLIDIGIVVNKKKLPEKDRKNHKDYIDLIDYEATKDLLDEIVDTYEPGYLQKLIVSEIELLRSFGYPMDKLLDKYKELIKEVDKLDKEEIMKGKLGDKYPLRDLKLLKKGDYTSYSPSGRKRSIGYLSITVMDSDKTPVVLKPKKQSLIIYDDNEHIY